MWISIWIPGRGRGSVQLCDVVHVAEASAANLISICQLSEKGIAMNIRNERMELYKDGLRLAIAIKINRMFRLVTHEILIDKVFVISGNDNPQLTLWQKRFGHLYAYTILKMSSKHLQENSLGQISRRYALMQATSLLRSLRPVHPEFRCNALYLLTRHRIVLTPCLHLSSESLHVHLMTAPASHCLFHAP